MTKHEIVVCTIASDDYLVYLERLLASASIHLTGQLFYVVLVNVDEEKAKYLFTLYDNLVIEHDFIFFNNKDEQRGYCTNRRALLFRLLSEKYDTPFVWLDVDSIFNKDASIIIKESKENDLSVIYRKENINHSMTGPFGTRNFGVFLNSIIMTNNSSAAKILFKDYQDRVDKLLLAWFADQEGLYLSYIKYKKDINFSPVSENIYNSNNLNCIIKTYKGDSKQDNEYYKLGQECLSRVRGWSLKKLTKQEYASVYTISDLRHTFWLKRTSRVVLKFIKNLWQKL